ncbi:hypothetical protein EJ06DRAFT_527164 [Trichodelitschia bisporula]|uniref:Heterokaryon incompatibility domain-containing protein n=1 Tax=Trichodelitschia bisporula TaxID=703511 RepID=A0A6G1I646_9PEZI|nr:hypothetical protein EJ06DRAFT_527164 [Trichodelitschia bisporula]
MRLLHTTSYKLKSFSGPPDPYCIISHKWSQTHDDMTFQQLNQMHSGGDPKSMEHPGFAKIRGACGTAYGAGGYQWIWIDSCCINKESSAELGYSLNFMYRWY